MALRSSDAALIGAEAELLVCCARLELEPRDQERIAQLLQGPIDWNDLIGLAQVHALLPLVHRHLTEVARDLVPRAAFVELWARYEQRSRLNQSMTADLLDLLAALDSQGIPALPYKGPALAFSLYGDVALREFGDLDILVRAKDLARAKALLRDRGYLPEYPLEPGVEAAFLRSPSQYHLVLARKNGATVELHWKTDAEFPVEPHDDDAWWEALGRAPLQESTVRCFAPRELALVLLLHGSKHYWGSLGWLVDVAELLKRNPQIDWDWVLARAASLGCERRVALGVHLADRVVRAPVPESVRLRADAVPGVLEIARQIRETLFDCSAAEMSALQTLRLNLRLYEGTGRRLAHLSHTIWSPSLVEWMRWPLPRPLFFLYPVLRLTRLTGKYLVRPLRRS